METDEEINSLLEHLLVTDSERDVPNEVEPNEW